MTHATPERTADERQEAWEGGGEDGFREAVEADAPAATAERFDITDMQHWIDLCG